jgi:RNA polymerase sigma-70 factor (ECF subfamily)
MMKSLMRFDQLSEMSDDALLKAYANGIPEASQILTDRFMAKIFTQAFHRVRNEADADDIAQEAMLRLWRIAPNWNQGNAKISTWLYKIVNNLCIDRLRQKKIVNLESVTEPIDDRQNVTNYLLNQSRANALYSALAKLPVRQREAVSMRHLEGISNPEIAEKLELSIEAVESLIARGKRALTDALQSQKSELGYQND